MQLDRLSLRNFRSCVRTDVCFQGDITVLVGENGAGKSAIIDAIRLVTAPASGRRQAYFDETRDLSRTCPPGESIGIEQTFSDLTEVEKALFMPSIVDPDERLVYTTHFDTRVGLPPRSRLSHTTGTLRAPILETENRERIAHVYLPPLRDAVRALDTAEGNRLAEIMRVLNSAEELTAFRDTGNAALEGLANDPASRRALDMVQGHLTAITQPARWQSLGLNYREQDPGKLARLLQILMADAGLAPGELASSGLGYANLLYIATVVIELERANQYDLTLLLVEEPEAHLHPQLQSVLLRYLEDQARVSAEKAEERDDPAPAGRIQVIVSTHSPNLTSGISTSKIVVVTKRPYSVDGDPLPHVETVTIALAAAPLSAAQRRKVDRYLTVTRAALLFARQVVLVEGIAESLLVRALAELCVLAGDTDEMRLARAQYRAISVITIDGVDFAPYVQLLLGGAHALAERVVVITDADKTAGQRRKDAYEIAFPDAVARGELHVHVGNATLEADLFGEVANEPIMRRAYLALHPRSEPKWQGIVDEVSGGREERARFFYAKLKDKDSGFDLGKGDFAHALVEELRDSTTAAAFVVPPYLQGAIRAALLPAATPEPGIVADGQ